MKFCRIVDVNDVISCVHFSDDRLRCCKTAGTFPIDVDRRPYNSSTAVRVSDAVKWRHLATTTLLGATCSGR